MKPSEGAATVHSGIDLMPPSDNDSSAGTAPRFDAAKAAGKLPTGAATPLFLSSDANVNLNSTSWSLITAAHFKFED